MKKLLLTFLFIAGVFVYCHSQDTLRQYSGKYNFPEGSVVREITLSVENNTLMLGSLLGSASLIKETEDSFTLPAFNGMAVFKRDSNKKITNITIDISGLKLEGTKDTESINGQGTSSDKPIIIIWETKLLTTP